MDYNDLKKFHDELISKLGDYSRVNYRFLFAIVYLALSSRKGENETIELDYLDKYSKGVLRPDMYTSTGISKLRIPPNSYFELQINPNADSIYRAKEFVRELIKEHPQAKLYFIYDQSGLLTNKVIREAKKEKLLEIWEVRAFLLHISKVKKTTDELEQFDRSWNNKRVYVKNSAKIDFQENKCSLFLGAGVSMSAGGPSWETLLYKAIKKDRKSFTKREFKRIYGSCGQSPIVMGRYIVPNKSSLERIADYLQRYVLYKGIDLYKSDLISAICEFVETDKVESIITYNYDDLVEMAIEERGRKRAYSVVAKSRNTKTEIPVYHVHGLIPHEKSDIASTPILSEKEYHDIYRESFHWSNIEQLHALDRNTCFFIGLSMTDPNLRRLLDFSHSGNNNEIHHYAFLKREPLYGIDDVEKNKRHFETIELQLESIGVWVIWYNDYDEVPQMIREIISPLSLIG